MSLKMTIINELKVKTIICSGIAIGLLLLVGLGFPFVFDNHPSSFTEMLIASIIFVFVISAIMITFTFLVAYVYDKYESSKNESSKNHDRFMAAMGVAVLSVGILSYFLLMTSLPNLPFYDDCRKVVDADGISMHDCMAMVEMGNTYTGQEIIKMVEEKRIEKQNIEKLENDSILNNVLKP